MHIQLFPNFICYYLITHAILCKACSNLKFDAYLVEIRKLTANVEAVLLGVIIPLCQRNSGRLEEADREVTFDSYFLKLYLTVAFFAGRRQNN